MRKIYLSNFLQLISSAFLAFAIANSFLITEYANYALIILYHSMCTQVIFPGVINWENRQRVTRNNIIAQNLIHLRNFYLIFIISFISIIVCSHFYLSKQDSIIEVLEVLSSVIYGITTCLLSILITGNYAQKKLDENIKITQAIGLLRSVTSILVICNVLNSTVVLLIVLAIFDIMILFKYSCGNFSSTYTRKKINKKRILKDISYIIPFTGAGIFLWSFTYINRSLIEEIMGPAQLAGYYLLFQFFYSIPLQLLSPLQSWFGPRIYRPEGSIGTIFTLIFCLNLLIPILYGMLNLFSAYIYKITSLIFSDYTNVLINVKIFIIAGIIFSISQLNGMFLLKKRKSSVTQLINVSSYLLGIIFTPKLIAGFGVAGGGISLLITSLSHYCFTLIALKILKS